MSPGAEAMLLTDYSSIMCIMEGRRRGIDLFLNQTAFRCTSYFPYQGANRCTVLVLANQPSDQPSSATSASGPGARGPVKAFFTRLSEGSGQLVSNPSFTC